VYKNNQNRKKSNRGNYLITALRQAFFLIFIFIRRYNLLVTVVTLLSLGFIHKMIKFTFTNFL